MAAETYQTCICDHKDVMHEADEPHACRSKDCECLGFFLKKTEDEFA